MAEAAGPPQWPGSAPETQVTGLDTRYKAPLSTQALHNMKTVVPMQSPTPLPPLSQIGALDAAQVAADESEPMGVPLRPNSRVAALRLFRVRLLNYLTNHVVAHVPSFTLRHLWYRNALGIQLGQHVGVHLGTYMWFNSRGDTRRKGVRIGHNSKINRDCTLDIRGGLTIGDNASVSAEVMILSAYHDLNDPQFSDVVRRWQSRTTCSSVPAR